MAGALQFAKTQLGGNLKGKKIAYLMYDNPAGKEALPVLEAVAKAEGFDHRVFAVPPPGVEMGAQILDLTQRYRPDFVVTHLFGNRDGLTVAREMDETIRELPGFEGSHIYERALREAMARVSSAPAEMPSWITREEPPLPAVAH